MWEKYRKANLKQAKGGIKAQTTRGAFGKSWWGKQWISALESFYDSARLTRGRTYARKGQVISIDIQKGKVTASVQGTRAKPYKVSLMVDMLSPSNWHDVVTELSSQARFVAKLLAGEMPHDIQEVFNEANMSLLPSSHEELCTDCSCPDWSNPCKHIAAVCYLLGEEFDRDPFLIFRMRGIDRDTFFTLLETSTSHYLDVDDNEIKEKEKLSLDPAHFWQETPLPEQFDVGTLEIPTTSGLLLRSLGKFPFWRGKKPVEEALQPIYEAASIEARGAIYKQNQ